MEKEKRCVYFVSSIGLDKKDIPPDDADVSGNLDDMKKYRFPVRSRCWGYYFDKSAAMKAARENWTDINEAGWFQWAVVEEISEGLLQFGIYEEDCTFLSFDKEKGSYIELDEAPHELAQIYKRYSASMTFALG